MSCLFPLHAWRQRSGPRPNGVWPITFDKDQGIAEKYIPIPCGKCIECKLQKTRQWAIRCLHESKLHEKNCFITLTYDDEHLPLIKVNNRVHATLKKKHICNFMKYLRRDYGAGIRFFMCGEYGDRYERPHYHACIFGHDFDDKVLWNVRNNIPIYYSENLNRLWKKGFATISEVTEESAAYTARYVMKKLTKEKQYQMDYRVLEYQNMSRNPGIGRDFVKKYYTDIYNIDACQMLSGLKVKPSRYYDSIFDKINKEKLIKIKNNRIKNINYKDNTSDRQITKEQIKIIRLKRKKRSYENGV